LTVKHKQIFLLSVIVVLMLAIVAAAAITLLWSSKEASNEGTTVTAVAQSHFESGTFESEFDMPALPNRLLESQMYDAASWPESSSHDVVNDSVALRAVGVSRYGKLEVLSQPGEVVLQDGAPAKFKGTYTVRYVDTSGQEHKLPDQVEQVLRQLPEPAAMKAVQLDGVDVLLFQPRYYHFAQSYGPMFTTYAYAITSDEEAFPVQFVYNEQGGGLKDMDSFLFDMNGPIESTGTGLTAQTIIMSKRLEITWVLDAKKHQLLAKGVKDRTTEYDKLDEITGSASLHIGQALGLKDVEYPGGPLPEDKLRALFTDEAWSNPGFQFLREEFAKQERETGNANRAFAWQPIDAAYTSPDTIRYTFTINLWYAIGLAGHLEAKLKQRDGEWIIADFGTLETEKLDDPNAPFNGLLMEDPLE